MSESNVLVNFRLDRDRPLRVKWLATDGVPGDGYKAQVTAILLADGSRLAMHGSSILEQTHPDASGGIGAYMVTFNGMVGYAHDHADRPRVEKLDEEDADYELDFVHEDGRLAEPDRDYRVIDRPKAMVVKVSHRNA